MLFPAKEIVDQVKRDFPKGTKVELIRMNDPYRKDMVAGLKGVVSGVDDVGTIFVQWDNGSYLGVVYGEDECKKL